MEVVKADIFESSFLLDLSRKTLVFTNKLDVNFRLFINAFSWLRKFRSVSNLCRVLIMKTCLAFAIFHLSFDIS